MIEKITEQAKLRIKIKQTIKKYCETYTSRQRGDLYDYLNEKLNLNLEVLDYKDKKKDKAKFACDEKSQKWETDYIVNKIFKLKKD